MIFYINLRSEAFLSVSYRYQSVIRYIYLNNVNKKYLVVTTVSTIQTDFMSNFIMSAWPALQLTTTWMTVKVLIKNSRESIRSQSLSVLWDQSMDHHSDIIQLV